LQLDLGRGMLPGLPEPPTGPLAGHTNPILPVSSSCIIPCLIWP
jgi:hypothetical protein